MNSPSPLADPGRGEHIARFEVKGELGHGGMANVLDVVDTASGARLALKIMLPNRMSPARRHARRTGRRTALGPLPA